MKQSQIKSTLNNLFFLLICIYGIAFKANAQSHQREILIGETVPDVAIKEIVNYKSTNAKLSEFKGKLLILDFWATYCAPCVGMFPKTDSLEKLFNEKVKFLPITKESKEKVGAFLNHMYLIRHIKPISIVNDKVFGSLFIYNSIPYYVWIDANGKVVATTGSDEITQKNIEAVLSGKPPSFENRKDIRKLDIDIVHSPLFVLSDNFIQKDTLTKRDEVARSDIFSYSIATKYIENAPGQLMFDTLRLAAYNVSVDYLYRWYYDAGFYRTPVFNAFDPPSNYRFGINDTKLMSDITVPKSIKAGTKEMLEWAKENAVCYEIIYPKGITWEDKMKLVKEDLDRYFARRMGFETHVEKTIDSNTAVLRILNKDLINTRGGNSEEHHDRYSYFQHNMPLGRLISVLNGPYFHSQKITFIDKSGFPGNVDLELNCDMTNLQAVNEALKKYGLIFNIEPSQIDVLVFSDTKL